MRALELSLIAVAATTTLAAAASPDYPIYTVRTAGPEGDTILESVEFGNGLFFQDFIFAASVTGFTHEGDAGGTRIIAGPDITGDRVEHRLGDADGDPSSVSAADEDAFNAPLAAVFRTANLNNFIDNDWGMTSFSFVLEFDRVVRDNEEALDEVGEIIYFERGANTANSYLVIEPVDEHGTLIGTTLLIDPDEPARCTPEAWVGVFKDDLSYAGWSQEMGGVSIDLTRLGVTELTRLRVRSAHVGQNGLTQEMLDSGGKDLNPDFKLVVVQTVNVRLPTALIGD